jgi:hypothetical protein
MCVVVLLILAFSGKDSHTPPTPVAQPVTTTQIVVPQAPKPAVPQPTAKDEKLTRRVVIFIQAYYQINTNDTEKSHLQYLNKAAPFISRQFLPKIYFGIEQVRDPFNKRRWERKLRQEADVASDSVRVFAHQPQGNRTVKEVSVPVLIRTRAKDGSVDQTRTLQTSSSWYLNSSGNWTLLGFSTYSQGSDDL